MGRSRGGGEGVRTPPLKSHKNLGFLSNTGPDPLKNHKVTKPEFNAGPSWARQRNRADDGLLLVVFGSNLKKIVKVGPHLTKLSGSAYEDAGPNCL